MLNKITLRATSQLREAEILLAGLPLDNSVAQLTQITEKIYAGKARVYEVKKNEQKIGVAVFEVYKKEFWVLGLICSSRLDTFKTCQDIIPPLARQNGCSEIVFWTLRPGLVEIALKDGFRIAHVELRKTL